MTDIHPTAIVDPKAELGANVKIGPYSVIGAEVRLGDGVTLMSHVVVEGKTTIGPETKIFPFSSIGHQPQDLKFKGEASSLEIGARNVIREHVTMNPGTEGGGRSQQLPGAFCRRSADESRQRLPDHGRRPRRSRLPDR